MQSSYQLLKRIALSFMVLIVAAAANTVIATGIDTLLVGHWRNTIHQPSINFAKDTHYKLFQDGSFQSYEKGIANGREFTYGPYYGRWSADGSILNLTFSSGEQISRKYKTDSQILILLNQTEQRVWNKLN